MDRLRSENKLKREMNVKLVVDSLQHSALTDTDLKITRKPICFTYPMLHTVKLRNDCAKLVVTFISFFIAVFRFIRLDLIASLLVLS